MMLPVHPRELVYAITNTSLRHIVGVPDSTLYPFLKILEQKNDFFSFTATNECEAVSIAAGHYLVTNEPSLVFLQNSGFGKTIHPYLTLLHPEICALPMVLMIGWRGAPDIKDEPQHKIIGSKLINFLNELEIPNRILNAKSIDDDFNWAYHHSKENRKIVALIVHPDLLEKDSTKDLKVTENSLSRFDIVSYVSEVCHEIPVLSTTGKISRELCAIREKNKNIPDFYSVGAMGCVSSIALGVAQGLKNKNNKKTVVILDGDGACLMQMGSLASIASSGLPILHILLDNGCHESTGGQPTLAKSIDLSQIAKSVGYQKVISTDQFDEFKKYFSEAITFHGTTFLHVKIAAGDKEKLGRPKETPRYSTDLFMSKLR